MNPQTPAPPPSGSGGAERSERDQLPVAVVTGAHGVHGGLRVKLYDRDSRALHDGLPIELRGKGIRRVCVVKRINRVPHADRARLFLADVHDRDEAEGLRGCQVWVRRADLPPLDDDEFYLADTVGLQVRRRRADRAPLAVGTVKAVTTNGAQDMLEVEWVAATGSRHRWLLPVLPHFIVEVSDGYVDVELPDGFLPDELEGAP